ncbi:MAG: SDR family oxidoreductase [Planctomycetota bacterium]|nr:SDR family oxidoreductase [Planctomycetota bacterium]
MSLESAKDTESLLFSRMLQDKRILVTGGSRGLGRAFCEVFVEHGAKVAFTYRRNEEAAAETVALTKEKGFEAKSYKISVLDEPGLLKTVKELEAEWGAVDILVNNAGVTQNLPFALMDTEDWDFVMDTNVKGTYLATKAVLRGMIRQKAGVILNIGSLAGVRIIEAPVHYCASKAALRGLTESLAKEMSRYQIRVNLLAPGLLEAGVGQNLPDYKLADYLQHNSLGRVGTFDEVARFAAFLISDANTYMSGETVIMDGGL